MIPETPKEREEPQINPAPDPSNRGWGPASAPNHIPAAPEAELGTGTGPGTSPVQHFATQQSRHSIKHTQLEYIPFLF